MRFCLMQEKDPLTRGKQQINDYALAIYTKIIEEDIA